MTTNHPTPVILSDAEVSEVAEMFPHAEYQPDVEAMPLCAFCGGAIDDHEANCVVPHVHALCATVRALRAEREAAMKVLEPSMRESGLEDACRQLKQAYISEADNSDTFEKETITLREQLAAVQEELRRLKEKWAEV